MILLGLMIIFLLCHDTAVSGSVIYIAPNNASVTCFSNLCLTLSNVAKNFSCYQDNASLRLVFLPGDHQLDSKFLIASVDQFSMFPDTIQPDRAECVTIICGQQGNFVYLSVDSVFIGYVNFINCSHTVKLVSRYMVQNCTFLNSSETAINIFNSTMVIKESMFISNSVGACRSSKRDPYYCLLLSPSVGSAITAKTSSVTVEDSEFERNCANNGGAIYIEMNSTIIISRSTFEENFVDGCYDNKGGVLYSESGSVVTITASEFYNNRAEGQGTAYGGVLFVIQTQLRIDESIFKYNKGGGGGVICACVDIPDCGTSIKIRNSNFTDNEALSTGGVLFTLYVLLAVSHSHFSNNKAKHSGGVIDFSGDFDSGGYITVSDSHFVNNTAEHGGGMSVVLSDVMLIRNKFVSNSAENGGGVSLSDANITFNDCSFVQNVANNEGGAINAKVLQTNITKCTFTYNTASSGGALHITIQSNIEFSDVEMSYNSANQGTMFFIESTVIFLNSNNISDNVGSLFLYYSNVNFKGETMFVNCSSIRYEEGGAITAFQGDITFEGTSTLILNKAKNGGAIQALFSKLSMLDHYTVLSNNTARATGGGIYLYQTELHCSGNSTLKLEGNSAGETGGGIHAIGSIITVKYNFHVFKRYYSGSKLQLVENHAGKKGGGIYLEVNAKLIVFNLNKYNSDKPGYSLTFSANSAGYGGAIYVEDATNFGTCTSCSQEIYSPVTECFLQTLILRKSRSFRINFTNLINTEFTDNVALVRGSNIFGGLLDRCTFNPFSKKNESLPHTFDGLTYLLFFTTMSNIDQRLVSSYPVKVCFCNISQLQPDCSYQPGVRKVKKGENFTIQLAAVDQTNHTVAARINIFLKSDKSAIGEGQLVQSTGENCTNLHFNLFSTHDQEELIMYADGPCKDAPRSQAKVIVVFTPCECPVGFQVLETSRTSCQCECDSKLSSIEYIYCNPRTKSLTRKGKFWITNITVIGATNGSLKVDYLIYPYCPLDYCKSSTLRVYLNLDTPNGADAQCVNNRSGILCGTCKHDLSLSLGSSHCIKCSTYWPLVCAGIVVVAILAGIGLVGLILVLNMTVAVGTLNGIIFYADVINANRNAFLPFSKPTFASVLIAWLNLDFGMNICFVEGLNAYWKTWLQLAFPTYVMFLVLMIICISERSKRVSDIIGKHNPVATLATLILLSYSNLLRTALTILSCAVLEYPTSTGSQYKWVWFVDATVHYLEGEHIALFILAVLILVAGFIYTAVLFLWQWLLLLHNNKWIRMITGNQKVSLFIDTYHAPYTPQSRYWTGLLLLVRIILYTASAANVSGNPKINLLTTGIAVICILLLNKLMSMSKSQRVYRKLPLEILEIFSYINLILFSLATFFSLDNDRAKVAIAETSTSITFVLLLGVISYHIFNELVTKTRCWNRRKEFTSVLLETEQSLRGDDHELISTTPTSSIIEIPKQQSSVNKYGIQNVSPYNCELRETLLEHID